MRNLVDKPDNQTFLRHILGLVRGLGLKTVAECVETAPEAALLRQQGVDFLQGYYFGKPAIERPWSAAPAADDNRSPRKPGRRILSSAAC